MECKVKSLEEGCCIEEGIKKRCRQSQRQSTTNCKKLCAKEERSASIKKISVILQKKEADRSFEESQMLLDCSDAVKEVKSRWKKRDELKRRLEEYEDPIEELNRKCQTLAQAIAQSQHLVVYTGAGISTAAKIPDYRGPNGIWTRLQQGKDIGNHDLSLAEPTFTHMALSELYKRNILKHVVSQNCDGLHLRSGLPRTALSELHGNMYLEVCKTCCPPKEYWRLFDVTENTARYAHKTMRKCYKCNGPLFDTIVHFGERGNLKWPQNWSGACKNAETATTIICLGSSLKVLKKYPWLWQMDKPVKRRPNLYIVNLQWTPKDDFANMKIHGKCDEVMEIVMKALGILVPKYEKCSDPIFFHATELSEIEAHTTNQASLKLESDFQFESSPVKTENKDCPSDDLIESNNSNVCDTNSNTNCENDNVHQNLPKNSNSFNGIFSIDNILKDCPDQTNFAMNSLPHNYLLLQNYYYAFAAANFHYHFNSVADLYYPYQTHFLYPGLHSIINPITHVKEENQRNELEDVESKVVVPSCRFCYETYKSYVCLFYIKEECRFTNPEFRFSKTDHKEKLNVCICCNYSTDEEEIEIKKEDEGKDSEKETKTKVQAGWFGKGYRKNRRGKRR